MALNKNNIFLLNLFWVHYVTQNFFLTFVIVLYFICTGQQNFNKEEMAFYKSVKSIILIISN